MLLVPALQFSKTVPEIDVVKFLPKKTLVKEAMQLTEKENKGCTVYITLRNISDLRIGDYGYTSNLM